jgi:arginine-tRNA-protein transferase
MAARNWQPSVIEYFFDPKGPSGSECGYCSGKTGICNVMWAHRLTCQDYKSLVDRGWSRVGKYFYKPQNDKTCCPQYAISCDASSFVLSKSQKKTLLKFRKYLETDSLKDPPGNVISKKSHWSAKGRVEKQNSLATTNKEHDDDKSIMVQSTDDPDLLSGMPTKGTEKETHLHAIGRKNSEKRPKGQHNRKSLEEFITVDSPMIGKAHRLDVNLVRSSPPSLEFERMFEESYALYRKYQTVIHHREESDSECRKNFTAGCVQSPLIPCRSSSLGPDYGSYHCHYYLDGRLFMVGVVDILPGCLLSVYLFHDPDFRFLTPGTFSALYEIAYTRKLTRLIPQLNRYYMDFYIHNTQKMKYKGNFSPSFLLCPETYQWQPIERCLVKLDQSKYARFVDKPEHEREEVESYIDQTLLLVNKRPVSYVFLKALSLGKVDSKVTEYTRLVGKEVAFNALLFIPQKDLE